MWHSIIEFLLMTYTVTSSFLFLAFHRFILKEEWDNDFADRVTLVLFITSNIGVQLMMWFLENCERCVK